MNSRRPNIVPLASKNNAVPRPHTQAGRVFVKFHNARQLKLALDRLAVATGDGKHRRAYGAVCRWNLPRDKQGGTGGLIPSSAMPSVLLAAKHEGIVLTADDLAPSPLLKGNSNG